MPQKLNKAGKMQDYIPAGNGDPSGEYGTSKGTNKNFTTSDKKKSSANVITENKSVVVENKEKHRDYTGGKTPNVKGKKETFNLKDGYTGDFYVVDELPNGWRVDELATTAPHGYVWVNNNESLFNGKRETAIMKRDNLNSNKANIIDGDLTGKKETNEYIERFNIKDANGKTKEELSKEIKGEVDKWEKEYKATKQKSEKQYGKRSDEARLKDIARLRYENIDALNQQEDSNYIGEDSGYLGYGSLDKLEYATHKMVAENNIAKKILSKK